MKSFIFTLALMIFCLLKLHVANAQKNINLEEKCSDDVHSEIIKLYINSPNFYEMKKDEYFVSLAKLYHYGSFQNIDEITDAFNKIRIKCYGEYAKNDDLLFKLNLKITDENYINYPLAAKYYLKLIDNNNSAGFVGYGSLLTQGRGMPKNLSKAIDYFLIAAKLGDADGQLSAGLLYSGHDGENMFWNFGQKGGLKPNLVLGYMWINIASSSGNISARSWLNEIIKNMTPSDIQTAQKYSTICFNSNFKKCPD